MRWEHPFWFGVYLGAGEIFIYRIRGSLEIYPLTGWILISVWCLSMLLYTIIYQREFSHNFKRWLFTYVLVPAGLMVAGVVFLMVKVAIQ